MKSYAVVVRETVMNLPTNIAHVIIGVFTSIAFGWVVGLSVILGFVWVVAAVRWAGQRASVAPQPTMRCWDCMSTEFLEGPHGGASINVKCANRNCGATFNTLAGHRILERIQDSGLYHRRLV